MYAFSIGDLEKVMRIPVPYRKWLIQRWNKQKEKENPDKNDLTKPLPTLERMKMIKQASQTTNKNLKLTSNPLSQVRNAPK